MPILTLTNDRGYHEIEVFEDDKFVRKLRIPKEFKVAEIERVLDLQTEAEQIAKERVDGDGSEQSRLFWDKIFIILEVLFKVYQPEITQVELRKWFSYDQALKITGFFENNRFLNTKEESESNQKKKPKSS